MLVDCIHAAEDTDLFKISDKHAIVTKFNEYFVNIGPTLPNKVPNSPGI